MRKIFLLFSLFLVLGLGCAQFTFLDQTQFEQEKAKPSFTLTYNGTEITQDASVDLGIISVGVPKNYTFTVENKATIPITVSFNNNLYNQTFVVKVPSIKIEAGKSENIVIYYNPVETGVDSMIVKLKSDASTKTLDFKVQVKTMAGLISPSDKWQNYTLNGSSLMGLFSSLSNKKLLYCFDASQDVTYYFMLKNNNNITDKIYISGIYNEAKTTNYFTYNSDAKDYYTGFTVKENGKIYIELTTGSINDSYGYFLKLNKVTEIQNFGTQITKNISMTNNEDIDFYYFNANELDKFRINYYDNSSVSGAPNISCFDENLKTYSFKNQSLNSNTVKTVNSSANQRLIVGILKYPIDNSYTYNLNVEKITDIPITNFDQWVSGNVKSNDEQVYSIDGKSNENYLIYWDEFTGYGSSSYTASIVVSGYQSDKTTAYFVDKDQSYSTPTIISPSSDGKIYLNVKQTGYNVGTYAIKVNKMLKNDITIDNFNTWLDQGIFSTEQWLSFDATQNTTYLLNIDDKSYGSGISTGTVIANVYKSDKTTEYLTNVTNCYTVAKSFIATETGKVYIKMTPSNNLTGTYKIKVDYRMTVTQISTLDTWVSDNLVLSEQWYYINANVGDRYLVYMDNSYYGSGDTTVNANITGYKSDKTAEYFASTNNCYSTPKTITSTEMGKIYFKVTPVYSINNGTFKIKVVKAPEVEITTLDTWGSYQQTYYEQWYYINATAGDVYYVYMDNSNYGSGTTTANTYLTGCKSDKTTEYFGIANNCYSTPKAITATETGKIYFKIIPYSSINNGTFKLKITQILPTLIPSSSYNTWINDSITITGDEKWYFINATEGDVFKFYLDDSYEGSGSKTMDCKVSIYRQDKTTTYHSNVDSAYSIPLSITSVATENIYIKIQGFNSYHTGTYAIKMIKQ